MGEDARAKLRFAGEEGKLHHVRSRKRSGKKWKTEIGQRRNEHDESYGAVTLGLSISEEYN